MTPRARIGLFLAFCTSVGAHGIAYASLAGAPREPPRSSAVSELSFELPPLKAPEPEAEPPNKTPEPAQQQPAVLARTPKASQPTKPETTAKAVHAPEPMPAAPPLDLSGVTLTNDTGTGFAMPTGDGSTIRGPIGVGAKPGLALAMPSPGPSAQRPPALVAANDLSEHPRPPALTSLLRANYPEEARQRGLAGRASVRARIDADGVIRSARLQSESSAGFGSACRRTLLGSHWSAPRDKNGNAVATEIVYTCHFEVDQ